MAEMNAELANFLRTKRQLLRPEMIGLFDAQERATADLLHRSDVAKALGVSSDFYDRVESGTAKLPSQRMVDALVDVLELTESDAVELIRLVEAMNGPTGMKVHPQLMALLDSWSMTAAFVIDNRLTVLASNPIAQVVSPMFDGGTNVLRSMCLDPTAYGMIRNATEIEGVTAAWARKLAADHADDASFDRMVGEILRQRPQFRSAWEGDVVAAADGEFLLDHPAVGKLDLNYQRFQIEGYEDQFLVTLHANPGTPTQCGLRVLKDFASDRGSPPW
jgi:transcriptional regulator with XRE-family HTH domain